jgi:Pentapeptide repeats (8 copies)
LQRLGEEFAEDVLQRAEESLPTSGDEEGRVITEEDVLLAGSELMPPESRTRVGPALIVQFVVLTLVIVAVIVLVFELTAKSLTHAESAVLVVTVFGAFYLFSRLDVLRRGRSLERAGMLDERFETIVKNLGADKPAIVRLASVYALTKLADERERYRQICIDVLCGYLRLPSEPDPGSEAPAPKRNEFLAGREVRNTIVKVITAHLRRGATVPWQDLDLDFTGADLSRVDFSFANLARATFAGATLSGANLTGAMLVDANLVGVAFGGANLSHADLHNADLDGADLTRADLDGADLDGADLTRANLTDADLVQARLRSARCNHARLVGANFSRADLSGAWLVQSDLTNADFRGAVLAQSQLQDSDLSGAHWDEPKFVPYGWVRDPASGRLSRASPTEDHR